MGVSYEIVDKQCAWQQDQSPKKKKKLMMMMMMINTVILFTTYIISVVDLLYFDVVTAVSNIFFK